MIIRYIAGISQWNTIIRSLVWISQWETIIRSIVGIYCRDNPMGHNHPIYCKNLNKTQWESPDSSRTQLWMFLVVADHLSPAPISVKLEPPDIEATALPLGAPGL
ncbi:hypothetical protein J6590_092571 [Homalodisca vitripennis]|nr:hypothetical protein J6590_092571 [Homalodisca vitripennis]